MFFYYISWVKCLGMFVFIEEQLAKVDADYMSMESTQLLRAGSIDERMLSFQRQLEQRYRSELDLAVSS